MFAAVPAFSAHVEGVRYAKPPARPTVSSWPDGLAAVIADPSYRDGYNYQNPGYVVENVDTFFYGGDTAALNRFIEKITRSRALMSVWPSRRGRGFGSIGICVLSPSVFRKRLVFQRAARNGQVAHGIPVTVTPSTEADVPVVIFLGSKDLQVEKLQLPSWKP